MKKLIYVLIVMSMVLLSSCAPVGAAEGSVDTSTSSEVYNPSTTYDGIKVYSDSIFIVVRFTDYEKGVTCYVMDGYESGGIFCLDK